MNVGDKVRKTAADAKAATIALKAAWNAKVAADEAWQEANRAALDATLKAAQAADALRKMLKKEGESL
jgi:hypothetical protein